MDSSETNIIRYTCDSLVIVCVIYTFADTDWFEQNIKSI